MNFLQRRLFARSPKRVLTTIADNDANIKISIIRAALLHVSQLGWTESAIMKGVSDLGLSPIMHKVVSRGPVELVEEFLEQKRLQVKEKMEARSKMTQTPSEAKEANETSETSEKISDNRKNTNTRGEILFEAISLHLDAITPYLHVWPSAMALLAEPTQLGRSLDLAVDVANDYCDFACVDSTRLNWYEDRAAIMCVYYSTELFMLQDKSVDCVETREFLRRRLETYETFQNSDFSLPSILFQYLRTIREAPSNK